VTRRGRITHLSRCGHADVESGRLVEVDTLWRIFSMTKPVTSVAAMMLVEEGAFDLTDPIAKLVARVRATTGLCQGLCTQSAHRAGDRTDPSVAPAHPYLGPDLRGSTTRTPFDEMYRAAGFEWGTPPGLDLAACVERWAQLPLVFQPGSEWNYSNSSDVLGRLVEVVSGPTA
jgi:CubicO group peptidase (beta-lactamase class C family)